MFGRPRVKASRGYPLPIPEWPWWEKIWLPITASRGADGVFVCLSSESYGQVCQVKDCFSADLNVQIIAKDTREWLDQLASRLFSGQCRFDSPCPTLSLGPLCH
jgi:cell wall assembly regulator SMI1